MLSITLIPSIASPTTLNKRPLILSPVGTSAPLSNGLPLGSGVPITASCWLVSHGGVWHSAHLATNDLNIFTTDFISFSAERPTDSFNEVDVKITIAKIAAFNIEDLEKGHEQLTNY